jgi:hypothetical protein
LYPPMGLHDRLRTILLPLHKVRGDKRMNKHQKQLTVLFAIALIFCVAGIVFTYRSLT